MVYLFFPAGDQDVAVSFPAFNIRQTAPFPFFPLPFPFELTFLLFLSCLTESELRFRSDMFGSHSSHPPSPFSSFFFLSFLRFQKIAPAFSPLCLLYVASKPLSFSVKVL